ncbi:MAG: hypothetical protein C4576_32950 [Desulfobacteraceae bacterium]|nr:MAG: hypothetical protein C4576_32950 [Desulfobacteraceae bacterium]
MCKVLLLCLNYEAMTQVWGAPNQLFPDMWQILLPRTDHGQLRGERRRHCLNNHNCKKYQEFQKHRDTSRWMRKRAGLGKGPVSPLQTEDGIQPGVSRRTIEQHQKQLV